MLRQSICLRSTRKAKIPVFFDRRLSRWASVISTAASRTLVSSAFVQNSLAHLVHAICSRLSARILCFEFIGYSNVEVPAVLFIWQVEVSLGSIPL